MVGAGDEATPFRLNPALDVPALAAAFARDGRVHIPEFLTSDSAELLHRELRSSRAWALVINQGEKLFELGEEAQRALTPERSAALDKAVYAAAQRGFQYRYKTIRCPDETEARRADRSCLSRFAQFLSSPAVVALFRQMTGAHDIAFADAQATAYGPGHFLTAHSDDVGGKGRLAAYVFNLTPEWRIDWGGLLLFHGSDGHVSGGLVPSFNALNLFSVPQPHSVSLVSPAAASRRISVTGWLRRSDGALSSGERGS